MIETMLSNQKKQQRIHFREIRTKALPGTHKLIIKEVVTVLSTRLKLEDSRNYLGIYWPLEGEVDIRFLKNTYQERIALPAAHSDGLISYHPWTKKSLKKDFWGIPAPLAEPSLEAKDMALLIVPAIAIDNDGYRLGYGGGFFDRLRSKTAWKSIPSLVVLPRACVSKSPLPRGKFDIPFEGWITEDGETMRSLIP